MTNSKNNFLWLSFPIRQVSYFFAFAFLWMSAACSVSLQAEQHVPKPFSISEEQLKYLAAHLAPKVDLFSAVWELDPEAEFYAGTTRDFLYWILGHFRGLDQGQISLEMRNLLERPFIQIREIVGSESDADMMTNNKNSLLQIPASDFGIRKLDIISFDRLDPETDLGFNEVHQGFIPIEKIRLSRLGIIEDERFGNGLSEMIVGKISVHFSDPSEFKLTYYAKQGINHPILLAIRYLRILSQDYLKRHGDKFPNKGDLEAPMSFELKQRLIKIIRSSISDNEFKAFLNNDLGRKWLNGTIQKSFRSYTNATAAFQLMKEMGVCDLIEAFPNELESIHAYLFRKSRNQSTINANFRKFGIKESSVLKDLQSFLPDLQLYHGTNSELSFRNIIYQGVIPSESGTAGSGFYGVAKDDIEFAKTWSKDRSNGKDDLVVAVQLEPDTRVIDIRSGPGKRLYQEWLSKNSQNSMEDFCEDFGIDILVYPYSPTAFVLKNSDKIVGRRGISKNPRPLAELFKEIRSITLKNMNLIVSDLMATPLTRAERQRIFSEIPEKIVYHFWLHIKQKIEGEPINSEAIQWLDLFASSAVSNEVWVMLIDLLSRFKGILVRNQVPELVAMLRSHEWPKTFWSAMPALISNYRTSDIAIAALADKPNWPRNIWASIEYRLKHRMFIPWQYFGIAKQPHWPISVWKAAIEALSHHDPEVRAVIQKEIGSTRIWPKSIQAQMGSLMTKVDSKVRLSMIETLMHHKKWSRQIWLGLADFIVDPDPEVRQKTEEFLSSLNEWPSDFWKAVISRLQTCDRNNGLHLLMIVRKCPYDIPMIFWNAIRGSLHSENRNTRELALQFLAAKRDWPFDLSNEFKILINDKDHLVQTYAKQLMTWRNQESSRNTDSCSQSLRKIY